MVGGPPSTVLPGTPATVNLSFSPTHNGPAIGSLEIDSTGVTAVIPLTANGIAPTLQASPTSIDFGSVALSATAPTTVTINNTGTASLSISRSAERRVGDEGL